MFLFLRKFQKTIFIEKNQKNKRYKFSCRRDDFNGLLIKLLSQSYRFCQRGFLTEANIRNFITENLRKKNER